MNGQRPKGRHAPDRLTLHKLTPIGVMETASPKVDRKLGQGELGVNIEPEGMPGMYLPDKMKRAAYNVLENLGPPALLPLTIVDL